MIYFYLSRQMHGDMECLHTRAVERTLRSAVRDLRRHDVD